MNQPLSNETRDVKVGRLKLLAVFAVAILPLLLAVGMYFGGWALPTSKTNKGNLVWPPVMLPEVQPSLEHAQDHLETKWLLLLSGHDSCEQSCQQLLHTMRQVNVAMGRELDRVERVILSDLSARELGDIQSSYPKLKSHSFNLQQLKTLQQDAAQNGAQFESEAVVWTIWLVDPIGNVVVQYTQSHDGYDMIDDLKKLLKLSNIG